MSLLLVRDLSLAFGARQLLADVSFPISAGDRVGFVGPNGAGKSTMMKLIAGVMPPDSGGVQLQKGARIGYLPQEIAGSSTGTLLESVLASVPQRGALQSQLRTVEQGLAQTTVEAEQLELSQQLADLSHELSDFEAQFGPHRAQQILSGLGFTNQDFARPLGEFSGGWRMRAALAGLLLQQPDLLLLDEPTNHLDLPTLEWFDAFLVRSRSALVLISHDREFLNRHIKRVVAIEPGGVHQHTGDYNSYEEARELRRLQNEAAREANLEKRAELQAFIDRFGAKATKAKQAQSRQKQLDKLETVQEMAVNRTLRFRFPEVEPSAREVLKIEHVTKRFGTRAIYEDATALVQRGDRIAIVGKNGAGKTTLLKLVANELALDAGSISVGQRVALAYYAQHHGDKLDMKRTIFEELDAALPDASPARVRQVAGAFMFSGDDIDKSISVLSGGERARVALAKLLLVPSNFLLLDEPTNHLDLDSSEALIGALATYTGTMLFVSHNESFVRQLATKIWQVEDGRLETFPGDFDAYLYALRTRRLEIEAEAAPAAERDESGEETPKQRRQREAQERQQKSAREKPVKEAIAKAEAEIAALEAAQKDDEALLASPDFYKDSARAAEVSRGFDARRQRIEALYQTWESLQLQLGG
ncbi:MAG: ABC-F family ATP-binding cassette domain-containing protein [Deltaproteobacteria bacterium]|nr:ABC-F family ATP-binding cassette domain-containing protein [Deltaproteobacteria bacterium]